MNHPWQQLMVFHQPEETASEPEPYCHPWKFLTRWRQKGSAFVLPLAVQGRWEAQSGALQPLLCVLHAGTVPCRGKLSAPHSTSTSFCSGSSSRGWSSGLWGKGVIIFKGVYQKSDLVSK